VRYNRKKKRSPLPLLFKDSCTKREIGKGKGAPPYSTSGRNAGEPPTTDACGASFYQGEGESSLEEGPPRRGEVLEEGSTAFLLRYRKTLNQKRKGHTI